MVKESPFDPPPMSANTRSQYVWVATGFRVALPFGSAVGHVSQYLRVAGYSLAVAGSPESPLAVCCLGRIGCHGRKFLDAWHEMQVGLCTLAGMLCSQWANVEGRLSSGTSRPFAVDASFWSHVESTM